MCVVLVPAYEPDARLVDLVAALRAEPRLQVLVVDDGSGPGSEWVFGSCRALGAEVVHHPANRGKGVALRTGFAEVARRWPGEAVVCADADGQHRPEDVRAVAARVEQDPRVLVLGVRELGRSAPLRSRVGNVATRRLFRAATGLDLSDTQTGLRGAPPGLLPWLASVRGDRYEYELEQLLRARTDGIDVVEVPVSTVYLDGNASSHFRPLRDGARVYGPLVRFAGSGLLAAAVDWVLLVLLHALTGSLALAVVGSRGASATLNYATNRQWVFGRTRTRVARSAVRYAAVAAGVLVANWLLLHALVVGLSAPLLLAKALTEAVLFGASFALQRRFVFVQPADVGPRSGERTPVGGREPHREDARVG